MLKRWLRHRKAVLVLELIVTLGTGIFLGIVIALAVSILINRYIYPVPLF